MSTRRELGEVFRWPIAIGVLSAAGLLSALVGDALWDVASWSLLSVPVIVALIKSARRTRHQAR